MHASSTIVGIGTAIPERVVTNDEIARWVDTTDAWIVERTGIRERRVVADDQATSDLAVVAARAALADAGIAASALDLIIVGSATPDMLFPATACLVQERLGVRRAGSDPRQLGVCLVEGESQHLAAALDAASPRAAVHRVMHCDGNRLRAQERE